MFSTLPKTDFIFFDSFELPSGNVLKSGLVPKFRCLVKSKISDPCSFVICNSLPRIIRALHASLKWLLNIFWEKVKILITRHFSFSKNQCCFQGPSFQKEVEIFKNI